ncbi:hypothetical protein ACG7TL_002828 [Trametes sanguinea]
MILLEVLFTRATGHAPWLYVNFHLEDPLSGSRRYNSRREADVGILGGFDLD